MFEVQRAGLLSTLQGAARRARAFGVPAGGAADTTARRLANALVGNPADALGVEMTALGPTLLFRQDAIVSLCGAEFEATLDGKRLSLWRPQVIGAGQTLHIGAAARGLRGFLAVRGGLIGAEVFGNASTDLRSGFGGFLGRALQAGDGVRWHAAPWVTPPRTIIFPALHTRYGGPLRVLPTAECTPELLHALRPLTVSPQSDRMGVRLCEVLPTRADPARPSLPTVGGMVQLPPDGRPIVLLPGAGTHGGYPTPLVVCSADVPRLGQLRPGDQITLEVVTEAQARELLAQQERQLRWAEAALTWEYRQREG